MIGLFVTIVVAVLVALKLSGLLMWSWWLVFAPLWISMMVAGTLVVFFALMSTVRKIHDLRPFLK